MSNCSEPPDAFEPASRLVEPASISAATAKYMIRRRVATASITAPIGNHAIPPTSLTNILI
jgi:hypothetical protein